MVALINNDYFTNSLSLPNTDSGKPEGEVLTSLILTLQPAYLDDLFGVEMAEDFNTSIEDIETEINDVPQKYRDIVFGKTFTALSGDKLKWIGLSSHGLVAGQGTTNKVSPLANYVYFNYVSQLIKSVQSIGVVEPNFENGKLVSPHQTCVSVYNAMVKNHLILNELLLSDTTEYSTYKPLNLDLFTYLPHVI